MNEFIWTDLSTYKVAESLEFYSQLFGWIFEDYDNYFVGGINGQAEVGIYETPAFFQKIKMPHFWMNYIRVENLEEITKEAARLNGKIEINDVPFYGGKIALIRDPMGAGFTVYQGTELAQNNNSKPSILTRELHTSDAQTNVEFYSRLFNWHITKENQTEYSIKNLAGDHLGKLLELKNNIKGKYEYWVTAFKVKNYREIESKIEKLKGSVILNEGHRLLVTDKFGEAFFYVSST